MGGPPQNFATKQSRNKSKHKRNKIDSFRAGGGAFWFCIAKRTKQRCLTNSFGVERVALGFVHSDSLSGFRFGVENVVAFCGEGRIGAGRGEAGSRCAFHLKQNSLRAGGWGVESRDETKPKQAKQKQNRFRFEPGRGVGADPKAKAL